MKITLCWQFLFFIPISEAEGAARKARLIKWKEEKEIQKKVQATKRKPEFKVFKIEHNDTEIYQKKGHNLNAR